MPNRRITLPSDHAEALQRAWQDSIKAWQDGEADQELAIASDAWRGLPEPKTGVAFSEALSLTTTEYAVANGRITEARVWLQLARESYGSDVAEITRANLDFQQGCIEHLTGNHELAHRLFDAVADFSGQRSFKGADPTYWEFHRQGLRQPTGTPLLPGPNAGTGKAPALSPRAGAEVRELFDQYGPTDPAVDALLSAYMLDREHVFATEDAKYLNLLRERGLVTD